MMSLRGLLKRKIGRSSNECLNPMIICSCNVVSDHEIRDVVVTLGTQPLNARLIYGCLGCGMRCGCCAPTIQCILDEALKVAGQDAFVARSRTSNLKVKRDT